MNKNDICYTIIVICLLTTACFAKYSGGAGEPNDPYLIATPNDLNSIGLDPNDWDKHFLMIEDINLADSFGQLSYIGYFTGNFMSIKNRPFTGVFDGNGHVISNLRRHYEEPNRLHGLALFAFIAGVDAEVKNLGITDPCVFGGTEVEYVSALVGVLDQGKVTNCFVKGGTVRGDWDYVAGLVGFNGGTIFGSSVRDCMLTGGGIVGAIAGMNGWGEIESCFVRASVNGGGMIGGLVGVNKGIIKQSYSRSSVHANSKAGGLIGENCPDTNVWHCYAASSVDANSSAGSFVGSNCADTDYTKCFWDSEINLELQGFSYGNDPNVIGLPTDEMQIRKTFADAGWDMVNVWDIGENQTYPFLRTYLPSDINKDDETNFFDLAILTAHWLDEK